MRITQLKLAKRGACELWGLWWRNPSNPQIPTCFQSSDTIASSNQFVPSSSEFIADGSKTEISSREAWSSIPPVTRKSLQGFML